MFSLIKKHRAHPAFVLPDRAQVTMTVPFMRAYTDLLVKTCHRRDAHAIGGMAAFIPNRREPQVTEVALARVRDDKMRESQDGFDGTWVAHPDLVAVAREPFAGLLGHRPHQIARQRSEASVRADQLLDVGVPGGTVTEAGLHNNVSVAIQYVAAWLGGTGAVALYNWNYPATVTSAEYVTRDTVEEAAHWVRSLARDVPWFVTVAFHTPHTPYHEPPDGHHLPGAAGRQQRFNAMVQNMDFNIGRLFETVGSAPIPIAQLENMVVIFIGDNGSEDPIALRGRSQGANDHRRRARARPGDERWRHCANLPRSGQAQPQFEPHGSRRRRRNPAGSRTCAPPPS